MERNNDILNKKKKQAWNSYIQCPKNRSFGSPTYFHKVGDKIRIGALQNCIVDEVITHEGLVLYGFTYKRKDGVEDYMYAPWYNTRPYEIGKKETTFTQDDSIYIRFYNTSLESLLNKFYLSGVDMNPPYQRDYVWDDKDKEALLDSIFNHIEIGKFAFINKDYINGFHYEILDGKQRLSTLLDFYENRLPYKGAYYNDLSANDRYTFLNTPVTIGETENLTMEQIYQYFYKLNRCGKIMSEEHLKQIRENIINNLEEQDIERE